MRASLISRELIADSIELMDVAHDFDALVCIVGCDKTTPAALMALARIDKPAVVLYSGPMRAGSWRGEQATIQDVWEAVGAYGQGRITRGELDDLERTACPGPGTCAGHFTANTMARRARMPRPDAARHHAARRGRAGGAPGARRLGAARWPRASLRTGAPRATSSTGAGS